MRYLIWDLLHQNTRGLSRIVIHSDFLHTRYNLRWVLARAEHFNLKINMSKCEFFKTEINFLGRRISSQGIQPISSNLDFLEKEAAEKQRRAKMP